MKYITKNNAKDCYNELNKIINNIRNNSLISKVLNSKNRRLKKWMTTGFYSPHVISKQFRQNVKKNLIT